MKLGKAIMLFWIAGMTGLAVSYPSLAADAPAPSDDSQQFDVKVGAYARHAGGKIVYHYRVINKSAQAIVGVAVGRDDQNDGKPDDDVNELASLPSGWTDKLGIPSTSYDAPTGWRAVMMTPDAGQPHAISWQVLNEHTRKILPDTTSYKMSVSLDAADDSYLSGHALITYDSEMGSPTTVDVPIDRLDISPPDFTVMLTPDTVAAQEGKYVAINASFMLKDDYDRLPEIKLESITANEPLGADDIRDASYGLDDRYIKLLATSKNIVERIYTVTYSATDASGNQSIASGTVTITPPVVIAPASDNTESIKP